ncbi:hypothetical protein MKX03_016663 [Papaver bracteatum]|nr:hypothetical protein MKX03_016663 [Papaver bracteatum]
MAGSKASTSTALFLSVYLLFLTSVTLTNALARCPVDTVKFGVCAKLLNGSAANLDFGSRHTHPCCSLVDGLVDFEAAVCLCTALHVNGINKHVVPINLSLILNYCVKEVPSGFECP